MAKFNKGDLVQLKSGGPKMTVAEVGDYGPQGAEDGVQCVWFNTVKGIESCQEKVFDAAVLQTWVPAQTGVFT